MKESNLIFLLLITLTITGCAKIAATSKAVIGGAVNAVANWWEDDRQTATAQQTARKYRAQRFLLQPEQITVTPVTARPGQKVRHTFSYAVLNGDRPRTSVQETCVLKQHNRVLKTFTDRTIQRSDGTFENLLEFEVPPDAPAGAYTIERRVRAKGIERSRQHRFTIRLTTTIPFADDNMTAVHASSLPFLHA